MTLMVPYGMNSALNDFRTPFGKAAADAVEAARGAGGNLNKLQRIAARSEVSAAEKAATVGEMLMSGALRAGAGPNGNVELQKRARERQFPVMSDDPDKERLNAQVGVKLAGLRGRPGHPALGMISKAALPGVGQRVRHMKSANDRGMAPLLPGVPAPSLNEEALEILNALPDVRVRNSAITAIMTRPPANPNDVVRWVQSIVALSLQINEMCKEMGLDPKALFDLLDRKIEFYDPMAQSRPATPASRNSNLGPSVVDGTTDWTPPAQPEGAHAWGLPERFSGADRTDTNPDFARDEKLAKFWDSAKRGVDLRKYENGSREQYEKYGRVVVESEIEGALKNQILTLHDTKKRSSPARWRRVSSQPRFDAILKAIASHPRLTRAMKGAALALIS